MGIINVTPGQTGLVGVLPSVAYINTDDTIAEVVTAGYLNKEVANGLQISLPCIAAVTTKATPTSAPQVGWYQVSHVGANWSLVIGSNEVIALDNGHILVGNASNIATGVAMSGDVTIIAAGTTAIGANKVLSSMLSPLMLKYAAVTMSAAEFNGAYAAPHLLVAAGGANTLIVLESAQAVMTYGGVQFAAGGVAHIQYDSTANGAGVIASSTQAAAGFADAASTSLGFNQGTVKQPFATAVNKGLYFSNVTGAFTTGDSTFVVHVWYRQIPTV